MERSAASSKNHTVPKNGINKEITQTSQQKANEKSRIVRDWNKGHKPVTTSSKNRNGS